MRRRWPMRCSKPGAKTSLAAAPRRLPGLDRLLADPVGVTRAANGDLAKAALDLKLVDRIGERRAYEARLAELGGKDEDGAARLQADQACRL